MICRVKLKIIIIVIVIFTINKFQKILQDPILLGPASEPKANGSCGGPNSHGSYVQGIKGLASAPNALGSGIKIKFSWVSRQDPRLIGLAEDLILLGPASSPNSLRSNV